MSDQISLLFDEILHIPPDQPHEPITLSNFSKKRLLEFQQPHVIKLMTTLDKYCVALDNSDTGIGKTYISAAICRELHRRPIICCPKTLLFSWKNVLEYFHVEVYDIVNLETLKSGRTYINENYKSRRESTFLECNNSKYQWKLPDDAIIIIDEAHKCKGAKTINGKFLISIKQVINTKIPVLLLSATICEKINDMRIPFYLFGLIPDVSNFGHYLRTLKYKHNGDNNAAWIHEEIKDYTGRIRIKDLGDQFPSNQIATQQFIAEDADKIAIAYDKIGKLMRRLKTHPCQNHLAKIQKLKQEIELRKVPIFIEQALLYLETGMSVIIFVNYLDTLHLLSEQLTIKCKIYGDQTVQERVELIELFQSNQERIIVCQIRSGGVGINLHDMHGDHPRVTLLNFPDAASDLLQALGRAVRSGTRTPVLQRIIFVANIEYEETIMKSINKKIENITIINDGDN